MNLAQIRHWFLLHKRRIDAGDDVLSISEVARRAGISRQTLYALLRDQRGQFGPVAQVRLSRVIEQISVNPAYQHSKLMQVRVTRNGLKLGFVNSR
jgi:hypothetical protein